MTFEEATGYALSEKSQYTKAPTRQQPAGGRDANLTRHQREIADLVARGMTNRRIAEELRLSEHTVATHVSRILKKLGLRSRVQIAAWVTADQMSTRVGEDPTRPSLR